MISLENIENSGRDELHMTWLELIGKDPPKSLSLSLMKRIIANELQLKTYGGLDQKTKTSIGRLQGRNAADELPKLNAPRLKVGARLMREWNGVTHQVEVIESGYLWQGQHYRSLSAIAKSITGAHWSGPRFFGLSKNVGANV